MTTGELLIGLSVAAPGLLAIRFGVRDRLDLLLALAVGVLVSTLWSIPVVMILGATQASVVPGAIWVGMATAILVVEWVAFDRRHPPGNAISRH